MYYVGAHFSWGRSPSNAATVNQGSCSPIQWIEAADRVGKQMVQNGP